MDKALEVFISENIPVVQSRAKDSREYEKLVVTSNLLYRFTRPPYVVQPENAKHVQTIVKQVKKNGLQLTIRCGGHSYAGFSTALSENCVLMDLRKMNEVQIDDGATTVTMDAGCQWGEVYKELIDGKHNGLVINGGRCPYVGVGGFILGAGLGPFTRQFGMGSDTLMEATIVTAEGEIVTVSRSGKQDRKKERLFWALQGAGQANFGVVTQMKLKIQRLSSSNGQVVSGRFQWIPGPGKMDELRNTMDEFYKAQWPNNMTIDSTWICDLRVTTGDGVRFVAYFDGTKEEFDKTIDKFITNPDVKKQLKKRSLPEFSTRFLYETLEQQWFDESKKFLAENKTYRVFAAFALDRKQINEKVGEITKILQSDMAAFRELYQGESVNLDFVWIHTGGEASKPKPGDTAYYWRGTAYHLYVEVLWQDKWMELNMRGFMAKLKQKLRPFAMNRAGAFVNFPDRELAMGGYERAYFGENRGKLRDIKKEWDKDNLFRWTQGIQLPDGAIDNPDEDVDASNPKEQTDSIATRLWYEQNWQHKVVENILEEEQRLRRLWI
ncbi:fumiquinazoline A oxidase [Microdochium nivale]|nr:fumiquinazoline A oxidase [Microdochium nivale]